MLHGARRAGPSGPWQETPALRPRHGHPRALLRVERDPGVLCLCLNPKNGALALLEDYPDAHCSVFAYPDDPWAMSLNPGEGWRTAFGFVPPGAYQAEAQADSGSPLTVFQKPGRAWLVFIPEDHASDLRFTDRTGALIEERRLFDPNEQRQCRIEAVPESLDLEALGGVGALGFGEPIWTREFPDHVVAVCDGEEGVALVCALHRGGCSADLLTQDDLHEPRMGQETIFHGKLPHTAVSGEVRLAGGRSEELVVFPGAWLTVVPSDERPEVVLRDASSGTVATIDLKASPRALSTPPMLSDDGGTSSEWGIIGGDDPLA